MSRKEADPWLHLGHGYFLTAEYTLKKAVIPEKGRPYHTVVGYFSRLIPAMMRYIDEVLADGIQDGTIAEIKDAADVMERCTEEIRDLAKKMEDELNEAKRYLGGSEGDSEPLQ